MAMLAELPCSLSAQAATPVANLPDGLYAVLSITTGTVIVELFPESAPLAVMSFVGLAEGTIPADGSLYFDNLKFHRVVPGFVVQTGDPTGTGSGGSKLPDLPAEFSAEPFERGTIGMARTQDPNSANSQFFICFKPAPFLNNQYTVVGRVISGMDAIDKIKRGEPDSGTVDNPDTIVSMAIAK